MVHILDDGRNDDNANLIKQHYHHTKNWIEDPTASLLELSLQNNEELDQGEVTYVQNLFVNFSNLIYFSIQKLKSGTFSL